MSATRRQPGRYPSTVVLFLAAAFLGRNLLVAWVYVGYPVVALVAFEPPPVRVHARDEPLTLTIAIAVHDEAAQVAARIADALAQDGPASPVLEVLVGSDGSTDATEATVAGIARTDPRVRLLALPRAGQTPTQHALFEAARGDVVILTDAETRFAPGSLARLCAPLTDPRVGAATGRLSGATKARPPPPGTRGSTGATSAACASWRVGPAG
jgi:cellulose synthase/poly-beta-1,6-N-acetylglucosamine synthase-like glycosyltransferase